jgi:hypothetical protein
LLILDLTLGIIYIAGLTPDIITSCCAVVFGNTVGGGTNLLSGLTGGMSLFLFYGSVVVLMVAGLLLFTVWLPLLSLLFSSLWLWYFLLALMTVTTVFSSYVYAMPFHKCPFCLLKPEYHYIGFAIYAALFGGAFMGMSVIVAEPLRTVEGMTEVVRGFQKKAVGISLFLLILFTVLSSYHYVRYMIAGGEG